MTSPKETAPPLTQEMSSSANALGRRLVFAAVTGWGYRGTAILCNLANMALLFRFLNKELLGLWFLMLGAQAFMGLFDFGFGQTLQRRIAYAKAACGPGPDVELDPKTQEEICALLALARRVYLVAGLAVFLVVFIAGWLYFRSLGLAPDANLALRQAWLIMSLGYAFNMWGFMVESSLNGLGDIGWTNLINAGAQIGVLLANWVLLSSGLGLIALAIVWLVKGLVLRSVGWAVVKSRHPWVTTSTRPAPRTVLADMVAPALQWWLALVGYFLVTGTSQYVIAHFLGAGALPDYAASYAALAALQGAIVGMVTVGTPLFSQMLRAGDTGNVKATILSWTKYGLGGLAIAYGTLGVWGKELFQLWLGPGHYIGGAILGVLMCSMLVEAHQGMLQSACVAAERLKFYKAILMGGGISLALAFVLIPQLGLLGAALASCIGQALTQNWVIPAMAMKIVEIHPRVLFREVALPVFLAGATVLGSGLVFRHTINGAIAEYTAGALMIIAVSIVFYRRPIMRALVSIGNYSGRRAQVPPEES